MDERTFKELLENVTKNRVGTLNLNNQELTESQAKELIDTVGKNVSIYAATFECTRIPESAKKAIEGLINDPNRQFLLGWLYDKGYIETKDTNERMNLYSSFYTWAAQQGHAKAQYNLAIHFLVNGGGAAHHDVSAAEWCKKAVENGIPEAYFMYGLLHLRGRGVAKDLAIAARCFENAANQGITEAQVFLAMSYEKGEGVQKDLKKAFDLYSLAAAAENSIAQYQLGACYKEGKGVARDTEKAFELFSKAAEKDYEYAMGELLENSQKLYYHLCRSDHLDELLLERSLKLGYHIPFRVYFNRYKNLFDLLLKAANLGVPEAQHILLSEYESYFYWKQDVNFSQRIEQTILKYKIIYDNLTGCKQESIFFGIMALEQGHEPTYNWFMIKYLKGNDRKSFDELIKKIYEEGLVYKKRKEEENLRKLDCSKLQTIPQLTPEVLVRKAIDQNRFDEYQTWLKIPGINSVLLQKDALFQTLEKGYWDFLKKLLIMPGIDPNITNAQNKTLLELAVEANRADIVNIIIKLPGVDVTSALVRAASDGLGSMVKTLLEVPGVNVNAIRSPGSETALWAAAKSGHESIVRTLLEVEGINYEYLCSNLSQTEIAAYAAQGKTRLSAEEIAQFYGHERIVKLIQNYKDVRELKEREAKDKVAKAREVKDRAEKEAERPALGAAVPIADEFRERLRILEEQNRQQQLKMKDQNQMLQRQNENLAQNLSEMTLLFRQMLGQGMQMSGGGGTGMQTQVLSAAAPNVAGEKRQNPDGRI